MKDNSYQITLPKGEALRPFLELNKKERHEIGLKIFRHVTELAAQIGALPVTTKTLFSGASPKLHSNVANDLESKTDDTTHYGLHSTVKREYQIYISQQIKRCSEKAIRQSNCLIHDFDLPLRL